MKKFYNDRVQSFHMQFLGVKWYDKIINAAIKLMTLASFITDRRLHSLFGRICRLSRGTHVSQAFHLSIDAFTGVTGACQFATLDCLLRTSLYDPQTLKRGSE